MSKKLFVGNLDWNTPDTELSSLFSQYGDIEEAIIIKDQSGRSKGFGFVTFTNDDDAVKAIEALNDSQVGNRKIVVNEARPLKPRSSFDRGGDRGGFRRR